MCDLCTVYRDLSYVRSICGRSWSVKCLIYLRQIVICDLCTVNNYMCYRCLCTVDRDLSDTCVIYLQQIVICTIYMWSLYSRSWSVIDMCDLSTAVDHYVSYMCDLSKSWYLRGVIYLNRDMSCVWSICSRSWSVLCAIYLNRDVSDIWYICRRSRSMGCVIYIYCRSWSMGCDTSRPWSLRCVIYLQVDHDLSDTRKER